MRLRVPASRSKIAAGAVAAIVVGVLEVVAATPALAATAFTVSTTSDIAANGGACGNSGITTAPTPLSLREATCLANNVGGTVTINIPAGTYTLASGELQPGLASGQTVNIVGAGSASTIIDGNHASRVFDIDMNTVGGVNASLSGLTVTNGSDSTFGGGGILAGSGTLTNSDSMSLTNVVVSGNSADVASPSNNAEPGGGVSFQGGVLTVTNSTFSGNSSHSSIGSGLYYESHPGTPTQNLTVTNSTFSTNSTANTAAASTLDGGALASIAAPGTSVTVTGSRFVNNTATGTSGNAAGAGIFAQGGTLSITGSTFTGDSASGGPGTPTGGAIYSVANTTSLHYNRFTGNTASTGSAVSVPAGDSADATENWWGCNTGPGTAGCESVTAGVTAAPRLVVTATASPTHVVGPNGTATLTAALTTDSAASAVAPANLAAAFDGLPVSFSDPAGDATVTLTAGAHTANLSNGVASIDYHSNTTTGPDNDSVTLDNGTVTDVLEVDVAPAITSGNTTSFKVGTGGSFTVTTTGYPAAAISRVGTLPAGLSFVDNGNGTATLAGTPTGPGGSFPLSLTANNGIAPNATQTLTVTVNQAPAFTSAASKTFVIGTAGSFAITTSGFPAVSTITRSGTLPAGLTFTDNGDGTATLAGTPTGSGGTYPVTLTGTNGVTPNATQALTIQVNQAPAATTNPTDQVASPGNPVSFLAAASGVPTPTVQWQRSTDGGASFVNIAGATSTTYTFTTALGDNGNQYRAVFTNAAGTATTTAATLSVGTAPAFASADNTSFLVGHAGTFDIATTGVPSATLSRTGAQFPAWLTLTDNGDGTGTLTGTPPAGSGGSYQFTLKAANGFSPSASQPFTLLVDDSPAITSGDHATFTAGSAGTFAVTTTAGFPTATVLTKTGSLPSGVSFTDNGDGTATIAGTPAAGTGGSYPITITASNGASPDALQSFTLIVLAPPVITSADHATFSVNAAGSLTVTTSAGNPSATTLTKTGTLPSGVSFTDNGDGTATIAGTPAPGTGGVYPITITASNGIAPDATQSFTLTVNQGPTITSGNSATFRRDTAGAFTVTTAGGEPSTVTLTKTGALPAGVSFTDNGDGTATIGGTPTEDGLFGITITASNGVAPDAMQSFALTVQAPPAITSADHTTFAVASAGSFTVTTTAGYPAATTLSKTGPLPSGVSFTDNGDGTATIAGTPAAGTGNSYPLTITATNGILPDTTQSFTLTVTELPALTSADHAAFTIGSPGSFTVTTNAGYPVATVMTKTGALPSGVSFTDNGDGTATLAGTPAAGSTGSYPLTITATNSAGHVDQAFTLTVAQKTQTITVTSIPPTAAHVGGSYPLAATSDSGLAVGFSIDAATTNSACSLTGSTVSFDAAGSCVVDFDQAGDGTYAAAPQVQQVIAVSKVSSTVSVSSTPASSVYGQAVYATATVTVGSGTVAGTVQFSVDGTHFGAPVTVAGGTAQSAALTTTGGDPLTPGSHPVAAVFTPDDGVTYASGTGSTDLVVDQAATTTTLTVHAHTLTAVVAVVTPGVGTPAGSVTFSVGGHSVGTATLSGGVASLTYTVPAGHANQVAATYNGNADYTASSVSTTRRDPKITAHVSSATPSTHYGWYRSSVTVRFTCTPDGAPLTAPCPGPVVLSHNGAGQSVTATISATDGGISTVVVRGIDIDMTRPGVAISGIRNGATYSGDAPSARCRATDRLSGVASCRLTKTVHGTRATYRATATDRAGNTASTSATVTVQGYYLAGATFSHGAFTVHVGRVYTLVVNGTSHRPVFYDAAVYPLRPTERDNAFLAAGHHRWTLGVYMQRALRRHRYWNIGVKVGAAMHVIKIRIA